MVCDEYPGLLPFWARYAREIVTFQEEHPVPIQQPHAFLTFSSEKMAPLQRLALAVVPEARYIRSTLMLLLSLYEFFLLPMRVKVYILIH